MNIIIVGCGRVGYTLVEQLSMEKHNITVIDEDEDRISSITEELDAMGIVGNGVDYKTLLEAGIERTDLLIAVTDNDEQNLLCCVMAKRIDNCKTIARVKNPVYNSEIGFIRRELGLSMIINPELIAASEIARIFQFPDTIRVDTFTRGRIELLHLTIEEDSFLDGYRVSDIRRKLKCEVLVCMVARKDDVFIPSHDFVLRHGDRICIAALPEVASAFFAKIGIQSSRAHYTMIVGGGTIGYYLARRLLDVGVHVKIIEKDRKRCDELASLLPDATVINADGSDEKRLISEGLDAVDGFAALTGVDEENVILSLFAGKLSGGITVTKIDKLKYSVVLEGMSLDNVIFPSLLTADYITKYARTMNQSTESDVENLFRLENGKVSAIEFFVREHSDITDTPISKLKLKKDMLICSITRDGAVIIPDGNDEIRPGDAVLIITVRSRFSDITDIVER